MNYATTKGQATMVGVLHRHQANVNQHLVRRLQRLITLQMVLVETCMWYVILDWKEIINHTTMILKEGFVLV